MESLPIKKKKIVGSLSSTAIFANIFIAQTLSLKSVPSKVIKARNAQDKYIFFLIVAVHTAHFTSCVADNTTSLQWKLELVHRDGILKEM